MTPSGIEPAIFRLVAREITIDITEFGGHLKGLRKLYGCSMNQEMYNVRKIIVGYRRACTQHTYYQLSA